MLPVFNKVNDEPNKVVDSAQPARKTRGKKAINIFFINVCFLKSIKFTLLYQNFLDPAK